MAVSERAAEPARDLDYYLAVPYLLAIESIERLDGEWVRRAEYPELPDCVAEAYSAIEAIDKLDEERMRILRKMLDHGAPIPVPRQPLRSYWQRLEDKRLGFARWLVEEGRITDR